MRKTNFDYFKELVIKANEDDYVWCAGYAWLDLTERQCNIICDILEKKVNGAYITRGGVKRRINKDNKIEYITPTGFRITRSN